MAIQEVITESDESAGEEHVPKRARENAVYLICYKICTSNIFSSSMVLAICLNTCILSLDQYPIQKDTKFVLEVLNETLSWVFFLEMCIMMVGLGLTTYAKDSFNIFDASVVLLSIVEIAIKYSGVKFSGGGFSSLRAIRLLRVFKLAKSWTSFRELLQKMV